MNLCCEKVECCNWGCNSCTLDTHQEKVDKIAQRKPRADRISVFSEPYAKFVVESVTRCSPIVLRYRFKFIADENTGYHEAGVYYLDIPTTYFLLLRAPSTPEAHKKSRMGYRKKYDELTEETYMSRPYTPFQFDGAALVFDLLIKLAPNGSMTKYFENLKENDVTEWKGVFGSFKWIPNKYQYLVCVCQGVAISPVFNLIKSVLDDESDETIIVLIACYQDVENIQLREEHAEFEQHENYQSRIYLSHEKKCEFCVNRRVVNCYCLKDDLKPNEKVHNYRLDTEELVNVYAGLKTNSVFTVFCGIKKLENVIKDTFEEMEDKTLTDNYFNLE